MSALSYCVSIAPLRYNVQHGVIVTSLAHVIDITGFPKSMSMDILALNRSHLQVMIAVLASHSVT
jgi:hypothetical protein